MNKLLTYTFLVIGLVLSLSLNAKAADLYASGTNGTLSYEIYQDGDIYELSLSGTGSGSFSSELSTVLSGLPSNAQLKATIGEGITGEYMSFSNNTNLIEVTLPSTITKIDSTFKGCSNLVTVNITPGSLTKIDYSAFENCTSLQSIVIPEGVTEIQSDAFSGCTSLSNIAFPSNLTKIGYRAFLNCTSLNSVTFSESIQVIESYAYYGCTSLQSVTFPASLIYMGREAFSRCSGLQTVVFDGADCTFDGSLHFSYCSSLTSVTLPSNLTQIAPTMFMLCSSLEQLDVPESVAFVGGSAFFEAGLKELTFGPNTVLSNSPAALAQARELEKLTINGVKSGGYIYDCVSLKELVYTPSELYPSNPPMSAFQNGMNTVEKLTYNCPSATVSSGLQSFTGLKELTICGPVTEVGANFITTAASVEKVYLPSTVTTIGDSAFKGCTGITEITGLDSVSSIGNSAFKSCTSLEEIALPSCSSYGDECFNGCTSLSSFSTDTTSLVLGEKSFKDTTSLLTFPTDKVSSYGISAFENSGLKSVKVPESFTAFPSDLVFKNCNSLHTVTFESSTPSANIDKAFDIDSVVDAYVSEEGLSAYTSACAPYTNWNIIGGHNFSYRASGERIIATCSNVGCVLPNNKIELSISVPASTMYDGFQVVAVPTVAELTPWQTQTGLSTPSISYSLDTESISSMNVAPSEPGEYKAYMSYNISSVDYIATKTFEIKGVTITFDTNGGETVTTCQKIPNSTYGTLPVPLRNGYTFKGWYLENSFESLVDASSNVGTMDHTLYAKWDKKANGSPISNPTPEKEDEEYWPFDDVPVVKGEWRYESVKSVWKAGLMIGTTSNLFSPDDSTTRGMIAMILYNKEGQPSMACASVPYPDVSASAWYCTPISWAQATNVVNGYPNGLFGPKLPATRADIVRILFNYAKANGEDNGKRADLSKFKDYMDVPNYAKEAFEWAVAVDVVKGTDEQMLNPSAYATRVETAALLKRHFELN